MLIPLKNHFTKSRSELSPLYVKLLFDIFFIFILIFLFTKITYKTDTPLIADEAYHITDSMAEGHIDSINPFSPYYPYFGHPPVYPMTVVLWFKFFPKNHISARYHALTFTFLTIFIFYLILFSQTNWISAVTGAVVLFKLPYFYKFSYLCLGNIPEISLFLLCFYFSMHKRYKLTAIAFFFLVMMRESGVSFGFAYILSEFIISRFNFQSLKRSFYVTLPGFISLTVFFGITYFKTSHFSVHPYSLGKLAHLPSTHGFFTIDESKFNVLNLAFNVIQANTLINPIFIFIISLITLYISRNKISSKTKRVILSSTFVSIAFSTFLFFYGDFASRDIGILIVYLLLLIIIVINTLVSKYRTPCIVLLLSFLSYSISNRSFKNFQYNQRVHYSKIVEQLETRFSGRTICLPFPISNHPHKIHGLFTVPLVFKSIGSEIHSCDIQSTHNFQEKGDDARIQKIIKENNLKPIFKDEYHRLWFKLYDFTLVNQNHAAIKN
jgi:hypothetical protein